MTNSTVFPSPPANDENVSSVSKGDLYIMFVCQWSDLQCNLNLIIYLFHFKGPSIDNFQIIGEAIPGERLLGCGYPVRGTSLCIFQVFFFGQIMQMKYPCHKQYNIDTLLLSNTYWIIM